MTIGERIKARRVQLGLSVDELSERLGKNRATVYRYESNEIEKLPTTVLEPLAKALNTTPAYLMGWEDEQPPEPQKPTELELSKNEREMIEIFQDLTETQQGELIGRAKVMQEHNRTEAEALEKENAS